MSAVREEGDGGGEWLIRVGDVTVHSGGDGGGEW